MMSLLSTPAERIAAFLGARTVRVKSGTTAVDALYAAHVAWAEAEEILPLNRQEFVERVGEADHAHIRRDTNGALSVGGRRLRGD